MAVTKLLNLLAISCLAVIAAFGPAPVSALSVESAHTARRDHHVIAAHKRDNSTKRCKPRSAAPAPSSAPTSSKKPSSSKAVAPPHQTSSGSGGDGTRKVGIAFAGSPESAITHFASPNTNHYYTWGPSCIADADKVGLNCCRMLWGSKQSKAFAESIKIDKGHCAMGMNEPNEPSQSNMSPQDAAALWMQQIDPLKNKGYTLVSPACTNAPSGKTWMQEFLKHCSGCQVDKLALHFYGTKAKDMISYIEEMYSTFGKEIWVTEFACQSFSGGPQCTPQQVVDFMKEVTAYMKSSPHVGQYFAFGALFQMGNVNPANQLLLPSGQGLTPLGQLYIG